MIDELTGHTADTNNNIVNQESKLLPIEPHTTIHSSSLRHEATRPDHPLNHLLQNPRPPRIMKKTIFNNSDNLITLHTAHHNTNQRSHLLQDRKTIHTHAVTQHLATLPNSSILNRPSPEVDETERLLPRQTRRQLAQLRANKSPLLLSYLHHIDPTNHPSPECPLCRAPVHDTIHLFNCTNIPTTLDPGSLWSNPAGAAALLDEWTAALAGAP